MTLSGLRPSPVFQQTPWWTQVEKVSKFTSKVVDDLRSKLKTISGKIDRETTQVQKDALLGEAQVAGDDFLALEKFVNLNYMVSGKHANAEAFSRFGNA